MADSKEWKEAELMLHFHLTKIAGIQTPRMKQWLNTESPVFTSFESQLFEATYEDGFENMAFWAEEDLKIYFISNVLRLSGLMNKDNKGYVGFFEKRLTATVNKTKLSVRADFLVAKGFKNVMEDCYFHFQEYKPHLNPSGEPMAQLLEAFLIGQAKNTSSKPLYGCEVIGKQWTFVIMEDKNYCVSKSYDATERDELLKIVAILQKFKEILETSLIRN